MNTRFIKHLTLVAAITITAMLALATVSENKAQTSLVTLTTPTTLEKAPNADGFIQRWLLLEPIGANGLTDSAVQSLVKKEHFLNQFTVVPKDGDQVTAGGNELTWHAVDTKNYSIQENVFP